MRPYSTHKRLDSLSAPNPPKPKPPPSGRDNKQRCPPHRNAHRGEALTPDAACALAVLEGALAEAAVVADLASAALGVVAALNGGQFDQPGHVGFAVGGEATRDLLVEIDRDGPLTAIFVDIKTAYNAGEVGLTEAIEAAVNASGGERIATKARTRALELA